MEIRQLYYVLEVAKQGNYSKAANALFVSQPNISKQIQNLEAELQLTLFKRNTHSVELTTEGKKFCHMAENVIGEFDKLKKEFQPVIEPEKTFLNISGFDFFEKSNLATTVIDFYKANPDIIGSIRRLDVYTAYNCIERGTIDFAVIKTFGNNDLLDNLKYIKLKEEQLHILLSKHNTLSNKDEVTLEELHNIPFISGTVDSYLYTATNNLFNESNLSFNPTFLAYSPDLIKTYITESNAVALGSKSTAEFLEATDIIAIPLKPPVKQSLYLVYDKNKQLTNIEKNLIHKIRDSFNT